MIKLVCLYYQVKNLKKNNFKKKDIKRKFGNQKYLNHLPHCTLCVIYTSRKSLNTIVKDEVFKCQNKKAKVKKFDIFFNDPITKGDTLIFKIEKNIFLKTSITSMQKINKI